MASYMFIRCVYNFFKSYSGYEYSYFPIEEMNTFRNDLFDANPEVAAAGGPGTQIPGPCPRRARRARAGARPSTWACSLWRGWRPGWRAMAG